MHEFSVANQAVDKIIKEALSKKAKSIKSVEMLVGELTLLGQEQLIFWMKEILHAKSEIADDIHIEIKPVSPVIYCSTCGYEGSLHANHQNHIYPQFFCPSCHHYNIEIKKGKECLLKRIQLEV